MISHPLIDCGPYDSGNPLPSVNKRDGRTSGKCRGFARLDRTRDWNCVQSPWCIGPNREIESDRAIFGCTKNRKASLALETWPFKYFG